MTVKYTSPKFEAPTRPSRGWGAGLVTAIGGGLAALFGRLFRRKDEHA
jgi:hypothetical protein